MMKKILFLTTLVVLAFQSFAAPGDTTIVSFHVNDSLDAYGNHPAKAILPNTNASYRKIYLLYTIGRYECPAGTQYCGSWDYSLGFRVKPLNPTISTSSYEIARGITPYATTGSVFNTSWKHTYVVEITDFAPILKDSTELIAGYSGYSWGFTLDTKIMYIEGTPSREVVSIQEIQNGYYNYGGSTSIEANLTPDTLSIAAPATHAELLVNITGHGSDNNGCSEFCSRYYNVLLNGTQIVQNNFWKKCGFCDIQAQTGTWVFDRGGWCPGDKVLAYHHKLPGVSPANEFIVDMDLEPYTSPNGGAGYSIANYVIAYKDPAFALDAELEDILTPTLKNDYKKFNPSCMEPMIIVKNNGTTPLNSATIHYGVKNQVVHTYQWSGNLAYLEQDTLKLPSIAWGNMLADSSEFLVIIKNANNTGDTHSANDTARSTYVKPPSLPNDIIIRLQTNNTALSSGGAINETSWVLYNHDGDTVAQRLNNANSTVYIDTVKLVAGCYNLVISDAGFEDGVSWWFYPNYGSQNPGNGSITLRNGLNGAIISQTISKFNAKYYNGDFGSKVLYNFKVDFPNSNSLLESPIFNMDVYPNPTKDKLHIQLSGMESKASITLSNLQGAIVGFQEHATNGLHIMDVSKLAKGMYILKLSSEFGSEVRKVIVE